jgi:hypothetical protein
VVGQTGALASSPELSDAAPSFVVGRDPRGTFVPIEEAAVGPGLRVRRLAPGEALPTLLPANRPAGIACPVCNLVLDSRTPRWNSEVQPLGDGQFVAFEVRAYFSYECPDCKAKVPAVAREDHARGCLSRGRRLLREYLDCPLRRQLLSRVGRLGGGGGPGVLRHEDGTDLLAPCFARSWLGLELVVRPGARECDVLACSLEDYQARAVFPGVASEGRETYVWNLGSTQGAEGRLTATSDLVAALDGYVAFLRPKLLPRRAGEGKRDPLFPARTGKPLKNLVSSADVFAKLTGEESKAVSLQTLFRVKEDPQ